MPAVLLCLGLIAAACGDDDASTAEGTTDAAATTVSRVESTTTSTSSTTTATSTPPTTAPASPRPTGEVNPYRDTIEYQPGVHLWVDEPGPCGDTLRPAIVTPGLYITPELVDHGYVVVTVDVRRPGYTGQLDAGTLESFTYATVDQGIAVQWLRAHAEEYCVDPEAIAAAGYSYGGISSLSLAYTEGELTQGQQVEVDELGDPVTNQLPPPTAPPELADYSNDIAAAVSFAGFALADTIDAGEPPAILFHGRNDGTIPFALAEQTCAAAAAVGVTCELHPHDEGHGFAADETEALELMLAFLEREMLIPVGLS